MKRTSKTAYATSSIFELVVIIFAALALMTVVAAIGATCIAYMVGYNMTLGQALLGGLGITIFTVLCRGEVK